MPKPTSPVELVKKAALEAVEASKPVQFLFGTVISLSPLKIQAGQKSIYTERMLVLTRNVTEHQIEMTASFQTGEPVVGSVENHTHPIAGREVYTVHNALSVGDRVLLARMQRGKKFIVLDRISPVSAL